MDVKIHASLQVEHEELHAELGALTRAPGRVGEAARNVAAVLHSHFVKEEGTSRKVVFRSGREASLSRAVVTAVRAPAS